jgi:uncharacterized protein Yka (UPF0111/DUF47 family)
MPAKSTVLGALDERGLLLPELLGSALSANERIKYYLSLLQMAAMRADAPDASFPDLRGERVAAGIDDERFDAVVAQSRRSAGDRIRVPHAAEIVERALRDLEEMIAPIRAARNGSGELAELEARLAAVVEGAPRAEGDALTSAAVVELASAQRGGKDSVHLVVMDLHKALNALAAELATRDVGGALTHGLAAGDEELVRAFMRGVDSTRRLKLDHPGLGTVASRIGARLVIQNDIGTTDAHVVVIHVEGLEARVTYTDVHIARLEFFQRTLARFPVAWDDTRSRRVAGLAEGETFFLCAGVFRAKDREALADYLAHLGSRLVFLIDWNRARRHLRNFVKKPETIALLDRAAAENFGHRGFLELGGERLVFDAMAAVMRTPFRFGERLHDMLGEEQAAAFLGFVLRTSAEGMLEGRSRSLLREQVQAELVRYIHSGGERLLELVEGHARLIRALGASVRDALRAPASPADRVLAARAAKDHEKQADELVSEARTLAERVPGTAPLKRIVEVADDAADGLEEAMFHLSVLSDSDPPAEAMGHLAELCARASDEYLRGIEAAKKLHRTADRATVNEFLAAIDRVVALEHETDEAERGVLADLLGAGQVEARRLFVISHVARDLEEAADSLMHAALALRDHVLGEVMAP